MNRLFLKIFLWFWATVIVVGIALVLSFVLNPRGSYLPWQNIHSIAQRVVKQVNEHGPASVTSLLAELEGSRGLEACLYDEHGVPVAGNHCTAFQEMVTRAAEAPPAPRAPLPPREASPGQGRPLPPRILPDAELRAGVYRNLLRLRGGNGQRYFFATEMPFGPGPVHHALLGFALHWLVVLLASSAICYLLTLWLTRPILRLRAASRQIADGNLHTRLGPEVEQRGDAFGDLARDFNTMAERIDALLSSQRQLITDVSHELRSPLTRMQLALDLLRKRVSDDPAFDQMGADLEKLDETIGRLLTVARLEGGAAEARRERVDLNTLLAEIAADAQLEAREKACTVTFEEAGEFAAMGDEKLLRSALENVVRNAVAYTDRGTEVLITLAQGKGAATVRVAVEDRGPGVPEAELENIFRPFYRVGDARDRQSGGTGLGLAIASRVIQLHQGTIRAENREGGGLRVTIELPVAAAGGPSK